MITLPTPDALLVVQLDPVDSVSYLDNPELTEACRKLKNKKYLAYVGLRNGLLWPDVPYYSYEFYFVHQGLKYEDELQQVIDPGMCAPILPNTSHPLGRAPLNPGQPLPWKDCYVSPFFAVDARSRNIVLDEEPPVIYQVGIDDAVRFAEYVNRDRQDLADRSSPPEQQDQHLSGGHCCCCLEYESDDEELDRNEWNPTDQMERQRELEEVIEEFEEKDAELMELVALKTSFDLTELDEVTDPAGFFEELKVLEKLKEEFVTSRKQREIEDANRIDEEYFSKLSCASALSTTSSLPSHPPPASPPLVPSIAPGLLGKVTQTVKSLVKLFYSQQL
ncbi:hypothetical protein VNI00_013626 [Paramarasmius palmivorus]|uniref:Uncharacterized protein n=1 Tax=Paramarasmius palmivorus TaxID=297713 RepID=A0AAW0BYC1_9AGAR